MNENNYKNFKKERLFNWAEKNNYYIVINQYDYLILRKKIKGKILKVNSGENVIYSIEQLKSSNTNLTFQYSPKVKKEFDILNAEILIDSLKNKPLLEKKFIYPKINKRLVFVAGYGYQGYIEDLEIILNIISKTEPEIALDIYLNIPDTFIDINKSVSNYFIGLKKTIENKDLLKKFFLNFLARKIKSSGTKLENGGFEADTLLQIRDILIKEFNNDIEYHSIMIDKIKNLDSILNIKNDDNIFDKENKEILDSIALYNVVSRVAIPGILIDTYEKWIKLFLEHYKNKKEIFNVEYDTIDEKKKLYIKITVKDNYEFTKDMFRADINNFMKDLKRMNEDKKLTKKYIEKYLIVKVLDNNLEKKTSDIKKVSKI